MKIVKENKVQEAVKPVDFKIQFGIEENGFYKVFHDGHKMKGLFDKNDVEKFIKLKLEFMKKFEALLK